MPHNILASLIVIHSILIKIPLPHDSLGSIEYIILLRHEENKKNILVDFIP